MVSTATAGYGLVTQVHNSCLFSGSSISGITVVCQSRPTRIKVSLSRANRESSNRGNQGNKDYRVNYRDFGSLMPLILRKNHEGTVSAEERAQERRKVP